MSVNFPAYVYVCRDTTDNDKSLPLWLNGWSNTNITSTRVKFEFEETFLECFYQVSPGTVKNKYNGVMSGAIPIHVNTVPNKVGPASTAYYSNMYVVLAIPRIPGTSSIIITIIYEASGFISTIFQYGLMWFWFTFLILNLLKKANYRIDRIMNLLVSKTYEGDEKNIIAILFMGNGESPCNISFRSHLFHSMNIIYYFMLVPFLLVISWGYNASVIFSPKTLGLGITWLGMSGLLFYYGYKLWQSQSWRMSSISLFCFSIAILFCFVFILIIIFSDPLVVIHGQSVNFASISILFGTINAIPLLFLVFRKDKSYKLDLKKVIDKMTQTVYEIAEINGKPVHKKKKSLPANKSLHALLGSAYTINPNVPSLKFGSVLQDSVKMETGNDETSKKIYYFSLSVLFLYLMIAIAVTSYPSIAFLNCLTLILFDYLHDCLANGETNWSPGTKYNLL